MISNYRLYAKKAFSVLLSVLLILSFSAFAFGEFTDDAGLTCTQQHVVPDFSSKNASYASDYFLGAAVPMDGSGGRADICVPGLSSEDNMIPQGIAVCPEKGLILVSAYYNTVADGKPYYDEIMSKQAPSVIYALDASTGAFVAQYDLYDRSGNMITNHLGGIAVSENNLYLALGRRIAYIPLSSLDAAPGTMKNLTVDKYFTVAPYNNAMVSFLNYSDGVLWEGNFYDGSDSYNTQAIDGVNSRILGFDLSGENAEEEISNLLNGASSPVPSHVIDLPEEVDSIQGVTADKETLFLSASFGRKNDSRLYYVSLDAAEKGADESAFGSVSALPMQEGIAACDGQIYAIFESAAWYYSGYDQSFVCSSPTDVIWRVDAEKMMYISSHLCACGKYHIGPFAAITVFFHKIFYFIKNLFTR